MNHQDFYLSHLYLGRDGSIYLIDLQRVGRRRTVPRRYIVKDLAQLNYSASHAGSVSRSERLRFFMEYLGVATLRSEEKRLARQINAKTERIAKHTVKLLRRRRQRGEIP
jgi:heptose I phosphotransferase